jgi:hypothetical protein
MSARIALPMAVLGALLAGLVVVGACALLLVFSLARASESVAFDGTSTGIFTPSAEARADIPPLYLALYREAASRYGLDWTILAGIGRALIHRRGASELRRRGRSGAVPGLDLAALRGQRRRARAPRHVATL